MTRPLMTAAIFLVTAIPCVASAQTVVSDPILEATARQQLAVAQQQATIARQQLAVLNAIQALLQSQTSKPAADEALAYAARQLAAQDAARASENQAQPQN